MMEDASFWSRNQSIVWLFVFTLRELRNVWNVQLKVDPNYFIFQHLEKEIIMYACSHVYVWLELLHDSVIWFAIWTLLCSANSSALNKQSIKQHLFKFRMTLEVWFVLNVPLNELPLIYRLYETFCVFLAYAEKGFSWWDTGFGAEGEQFSCSDVISQISHWELRLVHDLGVSLGK